MAISQALIGDDQPFPDRPADLRMDRPAPTGATPRVIESRAGRVVVRHEDGYVFEFQIHDLEELVMNLETVTWSPIGAPPDAEELEQQARTVAEAEAKARGWLS